ncbi:3-oxoacyl-[acyl-carrier-protein] synthase III C-terminal domain-containing protein [Sulfuricurvum sp. RIFCSPLOWO2_12_FULL_43_24]|uniref:3-oxoacyl-[acyl-carrier-protein] synthase III C-terminal domain-containing protein n=1 Tax=Sulfuricurvum sp. RIFCSPLOWO2_12_FULL_43_24 TaxID=1802247 RepID=UPI0008CF91FB|nr:3-oxoacyl-[acyl-carrier-protein] synthase III C-terminal domain-containing protein [Sulfuricurvum sp. RIFCSPLOWO2_12_FULL_43_24]OHD84103.1 MAG: hypothetical protein A2Y52_02845 [Sulfuricurvum sp. RIFCSPLOWO2_02_43_6]OHD90307.1 MAG: hypothetical protein A3G19_06870 [Sulfuricurvum sp. RIFCSPLOWO2_12_FULL_43_24]OHD92732.1 MAG: hypothetical protein A2W83_01560 [Sulfuricurvum sp. RIFCSPLOWO2_12_43_5]
MKKDVFIVGVKSVFPKIYNSVDVIDKLYSEKLSSAKVNKFATRLGSNVQIKNRAISIDLEQFPRIVVPDENSPVLWASDIIKSFSDTIRNDSKIEFISISYNASSHAVTLPNLTCQIAHESALDLAYPPEEIVNYGCTSGIFSIQSAVNFCQKNDSLATVFAFEQTSWTFKPLYDASDINFRASLRTHAIFGDGGAGLLLASGAEAEHFDKKLKIIDIKLDYQYGDVIKMEEGAFFTGDGVKDVMPKLVSQNIIKPILQRNGLKIEEVAEWSLHQGGLPVVDSFMSQEVLGLSEEQVEISKKMFVEYGNISTPSNFVVLEHHLEQGKGQIGDYGLIVGFGAGYYFGAVLYQHC